MATYITNGEPWVQQYAFNTTQSGDISVWSSVAGLPIAPSYGSAVVTKNRSYIFKGSSVYTAPIDGSGVIGVWGTATSLPGILVNSSCVFTTKNRIYIAGGIDAGSNVVSTVYTATISDDGIIGVWSIGPSLPGNRYAGSVVITRDKVYFLGGRVGGWSESETNTTFVASIDDDGVVGAWSSGPSLLYASAWGAVAVTLNRVYRFGGYPNTQKVCTATFSDDGVLSDWSAASDLPIGFQLTNAVVTAHTVYLLGSDQYGFVYYAPIASNGVIGAWSAGTVITNDRVAAPCVITSSRIYILGGSSSTASQYAPFSGGANDYMASGVISSFWTNFHGQTEIS